MTLSQEIGNYLPQLRRYSRALSGAQASGDAYVRACLQAIVQNPQDFPQNHDRRAGLYRLFHAIWANPNENIPASGQALSQREQTAQTRLAGMPPTARQAFLLTAMEGFTNEQSAFILGVDAGKIPELVRSSLDEIGRQTKTRVLIIEDEPVIALDLEGIVGEMGHTVTSTARTRDEAVAAAAKKQPGLVLADIHLADDSSGIDAVRDILRDFAVPVIFITAFPERLLTGERPEPTFLISKPFDRNTVKATIGQALFFDEKAQLPAAAAEQRTAPRR